MSLMRLGSIEFINSLPVDWAMRKGVVPVSAEIVTGSPAALNEKILNSRLDISPVSAIFYAEHKEELHLFPDLSISSLSNVQSVLLFSRVPIRDLSGKNICVSAKGRTTPVLLEILCRQRYGFMPKITLGTGEGLGGADAVLLIGDEALRQREELRAGGKPDASSFFVIDLAEEWRAWTGLPFVFAVWVARREVFENFPSNVNKVRGAILDSKKWGLAHMDEILKESARQTGLSDAVLRAYFSCLDFGLSGSLRRGMALYFDHAAKCGLLEKAVEASR